MVIDTNILIAALNAEPQATSALSKWKQEGRGLLISSVSVAEILSISTLTPAEITKIKAFLHHFVSIPFDDLIGESAGFIRRTYRLEIPDAAIAATAFLRSIPLVTRDRQFKKIKVITVIEI